MAGLPGSLPALIPPGEDETQRRLADLERQVRELGPSVAKSFLPMLALIVKGDQAGTWATNFAVPTGTGTAVATVTMSIPDGFSNALVFSTAHASVHNTTATNEYFYVGARVNGVLPAMMLSPMPANGYATSSGSTTRILTGLSGGTITIDVLVHSEFATWTASGSNIASIDAFALFYN